MNRDKFVGGITLKEGKVYSTFAMNEVDFGNIASRFFFPWGLCVIGYGGYDTQTEAIVVSDKLYAEFSERFGVHEAPKPNILDY